jgi:uncharacterized membrane protein YccC
MAKDEIQRAGRLVSQVVKSGWLAHSARTALATAGSFAVARSFKLPEAYWASVTTIVVMQSTLGAAWAVSRQRLIGTALGAGLGVLLAGYFKPGILVFGAATFGLGLVCAVLRLEQSAYRFAGVTLAIILLIARPQAPWITGLHRFFEVSLGIVVALVFTALWPQRDLPCPAKPPSH